MCETLPVLTTVSGYPHVDRSSYAIDETGKTLIYIHANWVGYCNCSRTSLHKPIYGAKPKNRKIE